MRSEIRQGTIHWILGIIRLTRWATMMEMLSCQTNGEIAIIPKCDLEVFMVGESSLFVLLVSSVLGLCAVLFNYLILSNIMHSDPEGGPPSHCNKVRHSFSPMDQSCDLDCTCVMLVELAAC